MYKVYVRCMWHYCQVYVRCMWSVLIRLIYRFQVNEPLKNSLGCNTLIFRSVTA
jgi:hypothetical protein